MNEAYLATARSRVSLARHARLLDYHVHQGNQASAWVALELIAGAESCPASVEVWAGREDAGAPARRRGLPRRNAPPCTRCSTPCRCTWSGAVPGLVGRRRGADLAMPSQAAAERGRRADRRPARTRLLIQEHRDPLPATPPARPRTSGSCSSSIPARRRPCATR